MGRRKEDRLNMSVRDMVLGRWLGREGRNMLGEMVNVGGRGKLKLLRKELSWVLMGHHLLQVV